MSAFLPVFDYGDGAESDGEEPDAALAGANGRPGIGPGEEDPADDDAEAAEAAEREAEEQDAEEALNQRRRAALEAVIELVEGDGLSEDRVTALASSLGKEDMDAMAEERALAGKCGNPLCTNPHTHVPGMEKKRLDLRHHRAYTEVLRDSNFCCAACDAAHAAMVLEGLALRQSQQQQQPQPRPILKKGSGAGEAPADPAARVTAEQIMADSITERTADEVSAATAKGMLSCLSNEAKAASGGAGAAQGSSGSVEGYVPKAWRADGGGSATDRKGGVAAASTPGRELQRKCSHNRRVSFSDDDAGGGGAAPAGALAAAKPPRPPAGRFQHLPGAAPAPEPAPALAGTRKPPAEPAGRGLAFASCSRVEIEEIECGGCTPTAPHDEPPRREAGPPAASRPAAGAGSKFKPVGGGRRRPVRPVNVTKESAVGSGSSKTSEGDTGKSEAAPVVVEEDEDIQALLASLDNDSDDDLGLGEGLFSPVTDLPELSGFGVMHTTICGWVTAASQQFLADAQPPEDRAVAPGYPGVRESLRVQLSRQVGHVLQALQQRPGAPQQLGPALSRRGVEASMDELLDTFYTCDPLPAFRVKDWRLLTALVIKALSHQRVPAAAPLFAEDDDARMQTLQHFVLACESGIEEFSLLHELIYPY